MIACQMLLDIGVHENIVTSIKAFYQMKNFNYNECTRFHQIVLFLTVTLIFIE